MRIPDELQPLVAEQRGLVTRRQLYDAGVAPEALRWAIGRSAKFVLPGVVATFTGQLDAHQRLVAGLLLAGSESALASLTAARWHGLVDHPDDGVVRVLVPHHQAARRAGFVVVRRTRRPDPRPWSRGPLSICSPARSLVDAVREARDRREVTAWVVAAVQRRLVRLDDVAAEVEAGAVRGSAAARAAVLAARSGAWSAPEVDMLEALAASALLPRVWPNPELVTTRSERLPSPDGWLDDVGLAVQVHSREYHLRDEDWEATVEADTALGEAGVPVLAVTPRSLRDDAERFRQSVERAYAALRRSGRRPDVVMQPRGPGLGSAAVGARKTGS